MKAIVLGGTGATGKQVVRQLLESEKWDKVTTVGRREGTWDVPESAKSKLNQCVVDMDKLGEERTIWEGHDVFFNCIGTTRKQAGSGERFREIEAGLSTTACKLAAEAGVANCVVISAQGANPDAWAVNWLHPLLYRKVIGEKEVAATTQEQFKQISIFRPGLLDRGEDARFGEGFFKKIVSSTPVTSLARAMIRVAEGEGRGEERVQYFTTSDIARLGAVPDLDTK